MMKWVVRCVGEWVLNGWGKDKSKMGEIGKTKVEK